MVPGKFSDPSSCHPPIVTGPFPSTFAPLLNEPVWVAPVDTVLSVSVIVPELCDAVNTYAVFNSTEIVAGSLVAAIHDQWIRLLEDTHNPHPRELFTELYISPIKPLHVPAPPVTVKLISICQLARDAISGNSNKDNVGILIAPDVA